MKNLFGITYFKSKKKLALIVVVAATIIVITIVIGTRDSGDTKIVSQDIMTNVNGKTVDTSDYKLDSLKQTEKFSIDLFKKSYAKGTNSLLSPPSIYLALGMVANGADGNTLEEFKNVLGNKNMDLAELNKAYSAFSKNFTTISSGKVSIANSIWYKDSDKLKIKDDFLQTNADYYKASIYKTDFKSPQTIKDMNNWVKNSTYNNIEKIVDKVD